MGKAESVLELIGQRVNGLVIESVLGEGGMGAVMLARDERAHVCRALKIIRAELGGDAQAQARFRDEAVALSRLEHDRVVGILDFGELPNGWLFVTMEYVAGPDLEQYLEHVGALDLVTGLRMVRELADAMAYAHRRGVVHRDLKPANIVLDGADPARLKIVDFGLAQLATAGDRPVLAETPTLMGSPGYMAPEQAVGLAVGPPADVYALASVAYNILTGASVFADDQVEPLELILTHCTQAAPRLSALRGPDWEVPAFLEELLLACLDKDPEQRPTAAELVTHLDRLLGELGDARPAASRLDELLWDVTGLEHDHHLAELHGRLTTVLLELARCLIAYEESARLAQLLARHEQLQRELVARQIELAAIPGRLDVTSCDAEQALLRNRRTTLRVEIAALRRSLANELHWVFEIVQRARHAPAPVPAAAPAPRRGGYPKRRRDPASPRERCAPPRHTTDPIFAMLAAKLDAMTALYRSALHGGRSAAAQVANA